MLLHACGGCRAVLGAPGLSRGLQGPPGASRGLQRPPGGSRDLQNPGGFGTRNAPRRVPPKPRTWARLKFHAGWSGWTRPPAEACLQGGSRGGFQRDLNALRLDASANFRHEA